MLLLQEPGKAEDTTGSYLPYTAGTNLGKALTPASSLNGGVSPWAAAFEQRATIRPPAEPATGAADQWAGLGQEQGRQRPPVTPQELRVRRPASTPDLRSLDRPLPGDAALPAPDAGCSGEEDNREGAAPSGQGLSSRRMRSVKDAARVRRLLTCARSQIRIHSRPDSFYEAQGRAWRPLLLTPRHMSMHMSTMHV